MKRPFSFISFSLITTHVYAYIYEEVSSINSINSYISGVS